MEKTEFLTQEERDRISAAVNAAEETTAGEIRVVVVSNSKKYEGDVRKNAEEAFRKYGLQNTKDATGVLIFLSVEERRIEILADKGINEKVAQSTWDAMINGLIIKIRQDGTCQGICDVVTEVGKYLTEYFPIQPDDVNELSNEIIVEND
jgi:putative membrane protein